VAVGRFGLAVGRFGHTENLWTVLVWAILVISRGRHGIPCGYHGLMAIPSCYMPIIMIIIVIIMIVVTSTSTVVIIVCRRACLQLSLVSMTFNRSVLRDAPVFAGVLVHLTDRYKPFSLSPYHRLLFLRLLS